MLDKAGLKQDLINYYGTAKEFNPLAAADLIEVDSIDLDNPQDVARLKELAYKAGKDPDDYMIFYDGD